MGFSRVDFRKNKYGRINEEEFNFPKSEFLKTVKRHKYKILMIHRPHTLPISGQNNFTDYLC